MPGVGGQRPRKRRFPQHHSHSRANQPQTTQAGEVDRKKSPAAPHREAKTCNTGSCRPFRPSVSATPWACWSTAGAVQAASSRNVALAGPQGLQQVGTQRPSTSGCTLSPCSLTCCCLLASLDSNSWYLQRSLGGVLAGSLWWHVESLGTPISYPKTKQGRCCSQTSQEVAQVIISSVLGHSDEPPAARVLFQWCRSQHRSLHRRVTGPAPYSCKAWWETEALCRRGHPFLRSSTRRLCSECWWQAGIVPERSTSGPGDL